MANKEKIKSAIAKIDAMLTLDYMTEPVRQELTDVKTLLIEVGDNL